MMRGPKALGDLEWTPINPRNSRISRRNCSPLPLDFAALPPGRGFRRMALDGGRSKALVELLHVDPEPVRASSAVAHQAFEPLPSLMRHRPVVAARARACRVAGISFALAGGALGPDDQFAPFVEVANRGTVGAGAARSVRVHPREGAEGLSISECMAGVVT